MPSDDRVTLALDALKAPIELYRSAVQAALAQVTDYLAAHRAPAVGKTELAATALGRFAGGRLDPSRFAATFEGTRVLSPDDAGRIDACEATLAELADTSAAHFVLELPPGADLEGAIDRALASLGRAFGAALVFQAVKAGVYREETHAALLSAFPFERWNRAERMLAPPLVVSVDGGDLEAAKIARFVDGRVRIVLVVRGVSAPAALVPLVTPGALVIQCAGAEPLAKVALSRGPAVVALVATECAHFTHDPAGGARLGDRLTVQAMPAEAPRRPLGALTTAQQGEQLAQLRALAAAAHAEAVASAEEAKEKTEAVVAAVAARGDAQAVDTLAGWLLDQAGLAQGTAR